MPLTKGCQNCSKRRINCDRRVPSCFKCEKRGLKCPGYGLNYRFNNGMASRGKQAGKTSEVMYDGEFPTIKQPSHLIWPSERRPSADEDDAEESSPDREAGSDTRSERRSSTISTDSTNEALIVWKKEHSPESTDIKLMASLEITDAKSRELLSHFSDFIASKMVALDGGFNGYRDLFLPLAVEDDLVRMAVTTASMYHQSQNRPELRREADNKYFSVIRRLRTDAESQKNQADTFRQSVWATIIILLTSETISGGSNLPLLYKMLQHLANANSTRSEQSALQAFLMEQTKMMTLFALPLLGDSSSVEPVVKDPDRYLDFLANLAYFHPDHIHALNLFRLAIRQACTIYLLRSRTSSLSGGYSMLNEAMLATAIDVLYEICQQTYPEHPGAHTLVWVYFIGAAESSKPEQREFYVNRLMAVYQQTKFRNIPIAINQLEKIWANAAIGVAWTDILPEEMPVFII